MVVLLAAAFVSADTLSSASSLVLVAGITSLMGGSGSSSTTSCGGAFVFLVLPRVLCLESTDPAARFHPASATPSFLFSFSEDARHFFLLVDIFRSL